MRRLKTSSPFNSRNIAGYNNHIADDTSRRRYVRGEPLLVLRAMKAAFDEHSGCLAGDIGHAFAVFRLRTAIAVAGTLQVSQTFLGNASRDYCR